jgi:hypothetical protein
MWELKLARHHDCAESELNHLSQRPVHLGFLVHE